MKFFLYVIIVISFLDTFVQLPIISPFASSLGASSFIIGLIVGIYSFSNMIGNVLSGQQIDKIGSKKIMIIGMLIAAGSLCLYPTAETGFQLLVIRFIHGIGGGLLIPAAFTILGDFTSKETRGKTMAYSGAAIGIAAIIGPAYGGIISSQISLSFLFYSIAILMILAAISVAFYLPEIRKTKMDRTISIASIPKLLKHPLLFNSYLAAFALMFTLGTVTYKLPLKVEVLGYSSSLTGILLSTYGLIAILFFILPLNRLSDRIGRMLPTVIGLSLIAVSVLLLSLVEQIIYLFIAMAIYGAGFAILFPAMTALVIDHSRQEERGRAFGLFYAFYSLGVVVGPLLIGGLNVGHNEGLFISFIILTFFCILLFQRRSSHS